MNKNIILASAAAIGAAALFLLIKKMKSKKEQLTAAPLEHSRHLTNVFANAKHRAEQS